jgi:hypothetical protein
MLISKEIRMHMEVDEEDEKLCADLVYYLGVLPEGSKII